MAVRAATSVSLEVLSRVGARSGFANIALDHAFKRHRNLDARDRALVTEIVYGTLRMRGLLDHYIERFSSVPPSKMERRVLEAARIACYQARFLDRVPAAAAVSGSVDAVPKRSRGFVNGLVRGVLRHWDEVDLESLKKEDPARYLEVACSHPRWLVQRWLDAYGFDFTQTMCRSNNIPPPLHLRACARHLTRDALVDRLREAGPEASPAPYSPDGIHLTKVGDPAAIPGFREGWFTVQDEAAQAVSRMVDPKPGERILDACAAPGGKSVHLAHLMGDRGEVVALDADPKRLTPLRENCIRLRLSSVRPVRGDASSPQATGRLGRFDRVLVDAPCSSLGLLRKNPEIRWRRALGDTKDLAEMQFAILANCARSLEPGGVLVFAVCTVTPEENEQVVERACSEIPGLALEDAREVLAGPMAELVDERGFLRTFPHLHGTDGFFAARFVKDEV